MTATNSKTKSRAVHVQKYTGTGTRRLCRHLDKRAAREQRRIAVMARMARMAVERAREELSARKAS